MNEATKSLSLKYYALIYLNYPRTHNILIGRDKVSYNNSLKCLKYNDDGFIQWNSGGFNQTVKTSPKYFFEIVNGPYQSVFNNMFWEGLMKEAVTKKVYNRYYSACRFNNSILFNFNMQDLSKVINIDPAKENITAEVDVFCIMVT